MHLGYGFVTFKYSEHARSALSEPTKKIDGRQTRCNYACERSNIGGSDKCVNSPNSVANMTSPNVVLTPNGQPTLSGAFNSNPLPTAYNSATQLNQGMDFLYFFDC